MERRELWHPQRGPHDAWKCGAFVGRYRMRGGRARVEPQAVQQSGLSALTFTSGTHQWPWSNVTP